MAGDSFSGVEEFKERILEGFRGLNKRFDTQDVELKAQSVKLAAIEERTKKLDDHEDRLRRLETWRSAAGGSAPDDPEGIPPGLRRTGYALGGGGATVVLFELVRLAKEFFSNGQG